MSKSIKNVEHTLRVADNNTATMRFTVQDGYSGTGLGCHTCLMAAFWVEPDFKEIGGYRSIRVNTLRDHSDIGTRLVDYLVDTLKGGFPEFGTYPCKNHVIISANWTNGKAERSDNYLYKTVEVMELIMKHCDKDPAKYGQYVLSHATDNRSHGESVVAECRTMIWIVPYAKIVGPALMTKPKEEPKVEVKPKIKAPEGGYAESVRRVPQRTEEQVDDERVGRSEPASSEQLGAVLPADGRHRVPNTGASESVLRGYEASSIVHDDFGDIQDDEWAPDREFDTLEFADADREGIAPAEVAEGVEQRLEQPETDERVDHGLPPEAIRMGEMRAGVELERRSIELI